MRGSDKNIQWTIDHNFGTAIAEQDAQLRGIRQISQQIVWTLTVFFKQLSPDTTLNYENHRTTS